MSESKDKGSSARSGSRRGASERRRSGRAGGGDDRQGGNSRRNRATCVANGEIVLVENTGSDEKADSIFLTQLAAIPVLIASAVGVGIIEFFFPDFFDYPHLEWGGWSSVERFWPIFLWCLAVAVIGCAFKDSPIHPRERRFRLGYDILTSIGAGLWEEIGYRCLFICHAMIGLMVLNFLLGSFVIWIILIAAVFGAILFLKEKGYLIALGCALIAYVAFQLIGSVNPQYWLYEYIFVPVIHAVTFHQMDPVLYGDYGHLFVFGAILANAWFRDGHNYQGAFGWINSWFAGLVFLYAALTYGLWTAVVVHVLCDLEFALVRYFLADESKIVVRNTERPSL